MRVGIVQTAASVQRVSKFLHRVCTSNCARIEGHRLHEARLGSSQRREPWPQNLQDQSLQLDNELHVDGEDGLGRFRIHRE